MKPISRRRISNKGAVAASLLSTAALVSAVACGSSGDSTFTGGNDGGGSGSDDDGSGIGNGDSGGGFGKGDSGGTKPTPDSGLSACAADTQKAKLAPLDLVLMQDTSGSMFEYTSDPTSKWDAIKSALGAFMTDPGSAGIGLGVQYFPIFTNAIPNNCSSNAMCPAAASNLCIQSACSVSEAFCATNADCGAHGGTCNPLSRCHGEQEVFCLTTNDCTSQGVAGPCDRPLLHGICDGNPVSCTTTDYASLAVPIGALPGVAATITTSLNAHIPNGGTPTYAALQGAIFTAEAYKASHSGEVVAVVFATDGIPENCDETPADIEALAAGAATAGVNVFVIGVLSASDDTTSAKALLNGIASSGGTTAATIIGASSTTESDFVAALQKIRGQSLPCQFTLPVPEAGTPDYSKVNVVYTNSKTSSDTVVPYVGALADCAADGGASGGWYYDVDPFTDSGTPTKVVLCPATCGTIQSDPAGSVDVVQGCKTTTTGGGPPR